MREYRVSSAELRGLWGTNIADFDAGQVKRASEALATRGMTVSCLATPFFKCELNADDAVVAGRMHLAKARGYGEQLEVLRRCADLAHQFGTQLIRVFSFWRRGDLTPAIEAQIVDAFAEPLKVAEQEGVTLLLENEHACYIGTGAEAARVLSEVNSPYARAVWDPGNALLAGEVAYPAGYDAVKPFVAHVHVKDAMAKADGSGFDWCVIGDGDIDYTGQFDALRRDGYDGYVSLETHYIPVDGSPEMGSRACLSALRRFIKD
jgi:sugar phosphate isomerase/epimerase